MLKTKYRIVTDRYLGYECQIKYWWFPFWLQMGGFFGCNTHLSIDMAKRYIESHRKVIAIYEQA